MKSRLLALKLILSLSRAVKNLASRLLTELSKEEVPDEGSLVSAQHGLTHFLRETKLLEHFDFEVEYFWWMVE